MPPLNTIELPDFKHKAMQSLVTFGLDSYIMAIKPIGTRIFPIKRPFGLFINSSMTPTGSSSLETTFMESAIAFIRLSVSLSLSIKSGRRLTFFASFKSFSFALIIIDFDLISALAIAFNALFLSFVFTKASDLEASFASLAIFIIWFFSSIFKCL